MNGLVVDCFVDGLEAVGVVVGEFDVGELLRQEVNAAVDDAEGV